MNNKWTRLNFTWCNACGPFFCAGNSSSEGKYPSQRTGRMATRDFVVELIFLSQNIFGILGNFSLLYHYLFLYCTGIRLKSIDLLVKNLIVANILVLLSCGFHNIVANFQWHHLDRDFACRFFPYVRVVGRGVSIGTTCLLSVFQVITISPRNSKWAGLKVKALKYIVPSIILCWVVNMMLNVIYPIFVTGILSNKSITNRKSFQHCSAVPNDRYGETYAAMMSMPVVFSFVVMILASGSTVFTLYRHKQRVQNVHRINGSSISSAESRATKTILLLMGIFISFNTLSSISYIILGISNNAGLFISTMSAVVISCFPAISPFLLMSRDSRVSRLCFAGERNANSPTLKRKV